MPLLGPLPPGKIGGLLSTTRMPLAATYKVPSTENFTKISKSHVQDGTVSKQPVGQKENGFQ